MSCPVLAGFAGAGPAGGDVAGGGLGREGRDAPAGLTAGGVGGAAADATEGATLAMGTISCARAGSGGAGTALSGCGVATMSAWGGVVAEPVDSTRGGSLVFREAT